MPGWETYILGGPGAFARRLLWDQATLQGSCLPRQPETLPAWDLPAFPGGQVGVGWGEEQERFQPPPPGPRDCSHLVAQNRSCDHPLVLPPPQPQKEDFEMGSDDRKDCSAPHIYHK